MFTNKFPHFKKGNILKKEMLENLRDYPRDFINFYFADYSDGIVSGSDLFIEGDQICINQGLIKEHHFFRLLESIDGATVDDKAFLTDFIIAFFEDRHAEAVHLGMSRLEGVIKHQLEASGTAITASVRGEDLPKTFAGLMNRLEGLLDEDYITFLRFRYHDATGEALRNRTAHGEIQYKEAHYDFSASLLVEIFRSAVYISELDQG